ncbi:MAG: hypothetical protein WCE79_01635 [Xanthobacteraceae bacterium]
MVSRSRGHSGSGEQTFEAPNSDLTSQSSDTSSEFESPPGGPETSGDEATFASYEVGADLQNMKEELERQIFSRPAPNTAEAMAAGDRGAPAGADLIVGVGIGPAHRDFESVGPGGPGVPVLNVYVAEKMDADEAKAVCVDSFGARALSSDRQPINVIHTGPIDAYAHRHRERPSPCGISVGHFKVTAGTQGALSRGRSGPRVNRLLLLSNNHVLANSNAGAVGDNIIQPGSFDGGVNPGDRIALLEKWVPINFAAAGVNYVDCATGWCWPNLVRKEFIYRSGAAWAYFRVGSTPIPAAINMPVGKSGRTTQLTNGRVIDVNASIRVNYGVGVANFRDQITIRGNNMQFSAGGDSGSLIWTWDSRRAPVGLLFAGGGEFTFGNKIARVLDALDINLYT